jgi:pimeloyl-ACP methyl ester carboxylesterase
MDTVKSADGTIIAYDQVGDGPPLAAITVPVLVLGGGNSPAWFRRSVAEQAAAIPGGRQQMIDGYDHNAPPEVIASILLDFLR